MLRERREVREKTKRDRDRERESSETEMEERARERATTWPPVTSFTGGNRSL